MLKYYPQRFTEKELLEIFPEAKQIIPSRIKEWELVKEKLEKKIGDVLSSIYLLEADDFSEWFGEEVIKQYRLPELDNCERNFIRLNRLQAMSKPNNKHIVDFQDKLEKARNYPIDELARQRLDLKQAGDKFISLCPFHNEKTPSFYLYPDSNSFHCFGCQEHGDVIKLAMSLHGVSFTDAIKILQN